MTGRLTIEEWERKQMWRQKVGGKDKKGSIDLFLGFNIRTNK